VRSRSASHGPPALRQEAPDAPLPAAGDRWALLLDVDGTLLEFLERPQDVVAGPSLQRLLAGLADRCGGALALISGRTIADLDRVFPARTFPAAGQHGLERRDAAGRVHRHAGGGGGLGAALACLRRFEARHPGVLLEDKGASVAIHYRAVPALGPDAVALVARVAATLGPRFEVLHGAMVVELRPAGRDKGSAIAEFLREAPFRGRTPVFIGDDRTDEFGFVLVNRRRGLTIKVGPAPTAATHRLPDAAAVRQWLTQIARRLR
jgi:trehalose 6-phosphate phosphatase